MVIEPFQETKSIRCRMLLCIIMECNYYNLAPTLTKNVLPSPGKAPGPG